MRRLIPLLLLCAGALAEDDQPRLAYGVDAATIVSVTWNRAADGAPSFVEYREAGAQGWLRLESEPVAWGERQRTVHTAWLEGLRPDTTYDYRVGAEGAWSGVHQLHTGPADGCTPFTFAALGDDRSDDDFGPSLNFGPILSEALETNPAFVLNGGDLVESGDEAQQWYNWLDHAADRLSGVPHMPTIGNHDDDRVEGDQATYNRLFTLPRNEANGTEDFYFFTYGDLIVVSLSSTTYRDDGWAMQAAWLDAVLTEHPKRWKIVMLHHPFYTSDLLGLLHEPDEVGQNAPVVPVLDRHHVDLVLQSHNHWYQRFEPSFGGVGDEAMPVDDPSQGTVYVTTGGSGAFTADIGSVLPGALDIECALTPGCAVLKGEHHFIELEMQPNLLMATVRATAAQNFGMAQENRAVIDQFAIEKVGAARIDCEAPPPPAPDAGAPDPDAAPRPEPDAATPPDPDAATALPDAAPVAPDAASPDAARGSDASPPAPDADLRRRLPRDAAVVAETSTDAGCGCDSTRGPPRLAWMLLLLGLRRRR